MYFLSSQPFLKMWYSTPNRNGMSVPERIRTYSSALAAVRVKRGSTTIILQAFSLACSMCSMLTGCASAAFEPMYNAHLLFCISLYAFVIAPQPHELATPETVVEWQMRAWWSQLLLPPRLTNLRSRYDCSLLCLDEPIQYIASGPLALRRSRILALISASAVSQLMRSYLPFTSFIG